jgi:putative component of membrane protein insertase Oxa1/YidC/SpoIIIJ protein YidD
MSPLRRWLRRPEPYLGLILAAVVLVAVDCFRLPERQFFARGYIGAVRVYQSHGRQSWIQCRFVPSCSEYSIEAVRRFGLGRGGWMTVRRLAACNRRAIPGSLDPVRED